MPWYYHNSNVVRPIVVKSGVTVAARPHTKIEIEVMTPETQALIRKGFLRPTGKPKGAVANPSVPKDEPKIEDVLEKSPLAKNIAEKGVTTSKNKPPKPAPGKSIELTDGEKRAGVVIKADSVEVLPVADVEKVDDEDFRGKGKKSR